MAFCSHCGQSLEPDARFCSKCGKAVGQASAPAAEHLGSQCPRCGMMFSAGQLTCVCGYSLREGISSTAIGDFLRQLDEIEHGKTPRWKELTRYINNSVSVKAERKAELIKNFAVPNSKEDIIEFLLLALPNIDKQVLNKRVWIGIVEDKAQVNSRKALAQAWLNKFEQVYQKARIAFGNDKSFYLIQEIYDKKKQELDS